MKNLLILFILALGAVSVTAQSYTTTAGMRLGTEWGLTVKQRLAKRTTLEGILQSSLQREEFTLTVLAEQHYPLISRRLNVYAGAGLHKGWNTSQVEAPYDDPFGLSLITGIEFTLGRLNLSYDFKPAVNIYGGETGFYSQTAVSMRYVLVKGKVFNQKMKAKKKRQRQKAKDKRRSERADNGFDWKIWKKD